MGNNYISPVFSVILLLFTGISSGQPSVYQTSWHGGPDTSGGIPDNFGDCFLEAENAAWMSVSRLSLEYPSQNDLICSNLPNSWQTEAADFNADGFPDLVIASSNPDGDIIMLKNPGNSLLPTEEWQQVIIASSFSQCRSVSSGDMDGDGDADVVLGCYGSSGICWLEQDNSQGRWLLHQVGSITGITCVDCGDIDQDGNMDILFCSAATDTLGWMRNLDGTGEDWLLENICTSLNYPYYASVTDIDSDGNPDVSACYKIGNDVNWYSRNPSDNTWVQHAIASVPNVSSLSQGDLNGDSFTDLVVCGQSTNSVYKCTNISGSGTTWNVQNLDLNMEWTGSCIVADIDDDGNQDIAVAARLSNLAVILSNTDGTGSDLFRTDLYAYRPLSLCSIDSDNDGTPELACLCKNEMRLQSAAPGSFTQEGTLTSLVVWVPQTTDSEWGFITWNSWEPSGTYLGFQVRNSNDPNNMGEWSDTVTANGTYLGDLFPEVDLFIQYRAILSSDSPEKTPFLYHVDLGGYTGATSDQSSGLLGLPLLSFAENPSVSSLTVEVAPYGSDDRKLMVFDLSGRLVAFRSVNHQTTLPGWSSTTCPPGSILLWLKLAATGRLKECVFSAEETL